MKTTFIITSAINTQQSETFTIFESERGSLDSKDRLSEKTWVDLAELVDSDL